MDEAKGARRRLSPPQRRIGELCALGQAAATQPADRMILGAFVTSVFAVDYLTRLLDPTDGSFVSTFHAAEFFGFATMAFLLLKLGPKPLLRASDLALISVAALFLLRSWRFGGAMALTVVGGSITTRQDRDLASFGQLCLGLAWIDLWGKLTLSFIAPWILPAETALSFYFLPLFGSFTMVGNSIGNGADHSIAVYLGCSAFANTVSTAFIWLCLVKLAESEFCRRHYLGLAASLACVVLINIGRIALMAYSAEQYVFWHDGAGASIVSIGMLACILGIFLVAQFRPAGAVK
jgi:hypothetical protein